jgi:hypothetical protein
MVISCQPLSCPTLCRNPEGSHDCNKADGHLFFDDMKWRGTTRGGSSGGKRVDAAAAGLEPSVFVGTLSLFRRFLLPPTLGHAAVTSSSSSLLLLLLLRLLLPATTHQSSLGSNSGCITSRRVLLAHCFIHNPCSGTRKNSLAFGTTRLVDVVKGTATMLSLMMDRNQRHCAVTGCSGLPELWQVSTSFSRVDTQNGPLG